MPSAADDGWFGYVMAIKMFALLDTAKSVSKVDAQTVVWIDAWLYPHYRLEDNYSNGVSLSRDEGIFYDGPLTDFPSSTAGKSQYERLQRGGADFERQILQLSQAFKLWIEKVVPMGTPLTVVASKTEGFFNKLRQEMGV